MAGTTGFALFHIFHGRPIRTSHRFEQLWMAVVAAEHVGVGCVWEVHVAGVFLLEEDVTGVAGSAVTARAKRSIAIVAGTA